MLMMTNSNTSEMTCYSCHYSEQVESGDLRCAKTGLRGVMMAADCPMFVYAPGTDENEREKNDNTKR